LRLRAQPAALAGLGGLAGTLICCALLAAGAAGAGNGVFLPGDAGLWPSWLASPLQILGLRIAAGGFQTLTLLLVASYALLLIGRAALPKRAIWPTLVASYALLALGPPLLSRDLIGYISYARMGVLYGLDPYSHVPASAPGDPLFALVGWPGQHTPYGPLFTILSYPLALLGPLGAYWAFKALAALATLLAVWLLARTAPARRRSPSAVAIFVGFNPALLEVTLGGDHNDTLLLALVALALALIFAPAARLRGGAAALVGAAALKLSAIVALPFMLACPAPAGRRLGRRERLSLLGAAALSLLAAALIALLVFGANALGFLGAIGAEQSFVSPHAIPAQLASLAGLSGTPGWWRALFLAIFLALCSFLMLRTARGADWVTCAGFAMIAICLCSAWFLPWYASWALPFAALSSSRTLRGATVGLCVYALAFHLPAAAGILATAHTYGGHALPGYLAIALGR
jgi:alpha-1,6-mannosyltransferase